MDETIRHRVLLAIKLICICILVIIFAHRGAWTQEKISSVPALMEALEDEDEDVRLSAALVLAQIEPGADKVVPVLIDALKNEDVRWDAVDALRQIGRLAVPALMEALEDEDEDVRQIVVEALVEIGPPSVPSLKKALKDKNFYVRRAAVIALKQIKDYGDVRYQRRIVEAEDIINELKSNDNVYQSLVYENCIIRGDLNLFKLTDLKDPKTNEIIIKRPLNFSKSVFLGRIRSWDQSVRLEDQPRVLFERSVNFSNCYFENDVSLGKAIFKDEAYFGGAHFFKMASFTQAKFKEKASFHSARFDERALFHKTVFEGDVIFDMAVFNWLAFFHEVKIDSTIITVDGFSDWGALLSVVKGDRNNFPVKLLKSNLGDEEFNKIKSVSDASDLTYLMKDAILEAFNDIMNDLNFYSEEASQIALKDNTEAKYWFNELFRKGIFYKDDSGVWKIKDDLLQSDEEDIKWFNIAVLRQVYPKILTNFLKIKKGGWASFLYTTFKGDTIFVKTWFGRTARFQGSHFYGSAYFSESIFEEEARFVGGAQFDNTVTFKNARFEKKGLIVYGGFPIITAVNDSDQGALLSVVKGDTNDFPVKLLKSNLGDEEFNKIKSVSDASDLTDLMKGAIVDAFIDIKNDLNFYSEEASQITLEDNTEAKDQFKKLVRKGIFHIDKGVWKIKDDLYLSQSDEKDIKWFNIAILRQVYPNIQIKTKKRTERPPVIFSDVVFSEDVIFSGAKFHSVAFGNVQTGVYLGMDTIFRKEADFRNTTFDTLKLRDVVFQSEVDFSGSKFNEVVDITDLDIGKASVKIGWDQFIDTKIEKPKFEWQDAFKNGELDENRTDMACTNFLSFLDLLKKNFQKQGNLSDAAKVHYFKEELKGGQNSGIKWLWSVVFLKVIYGHGVKPLNQIAVSFLLIVGFAFVYGRKNVLHYDRTKQRKLRFNIVDIPIDWAGTKEAASAIKSTRKQGFIARYRKGFLFSLYVFIKYGYGGVYVSRRYKYAVLVEWVLGIVVLVLFFVNLSNTWPLLYRIVSLIS